MPGWPGQTAFEKMTGMILDKILPGSASIPAAFFRTTNMSANLNQFVTQQLNHSSGRRLLMCGYSRCGGTDVCGR